MKSAKFPLTIVTELYERMDGTHETENFADFPIDKRIPYEATPTLLINFRAAQRLPHHPRNTARNTTPEIK